MAGLLAANMLRRYEPEVHEIQPSLPSNHGALLRFRSDAVAKATGQPFKRVRVHKTILWRDELVTAPTLQMANAYSLKVTGRVLPRSILNTEPVDRWIAPPDFIKKMMAGVNITYNSPLNEVAVIDSEIFRPCISTIPMPVLMDIVRWDKKPIFLYDTIISATIKIIDPMVDVYQTIYAPEYDALWYRASITGNVLILEFMKDHLPNWHIKDIEEQRDFLHNSIHKALVLFGLDNDFLFTPEFEPAIIKEQKFGKLKPIDNVARRSFILGMTRKYGIYSLGRFATWRQLLLDDVVNDVHVIDRFIQDSTEYESHLGSVSDGS